MANAVKPIPDGYKHATPNLCVANGAAAIDFYTRAFGATELYRLAEPNGKVGHAEIKIGEALFALADEYPDLGYRGPRSLGGSPVTIQLYVEDVDALAERAVAAGATLKRPPEDQFYGDRSCTIEDPFGHVWMFNTHIEDISPEEMQRRYAEIMKAQA